MWQSWRKSFRLVISLTILSSLLSGCLYPDERRAENQIPSTFFVEATQKAIEQFQKDTAVLPIVTKSLDTPIFEKYEIDFRKMIPKYMPDVPGNAFEKGGVYKYVLIDVDTKPTVKLIHLTAVSTVADVQSEVDRYKGHFEKLPVLADLGNGYYSIDHDRLGLKAWQVPSTMGTYLLPLVMNAEGQVGIDYAADIAQLLRDTKVTVPEKTDPRYVLARNSMFVPAKSFPYEMVDGEPKLLKLN
ncbi:hypothetical protein [Brevibacillus brevis]|uniref:hypothetical protein n=1 Tax=Brevibacillus brevis TaxID=1393 RepID=UPI000D0F36CA|nr:hypothetical protein [Brevibacillus brevis]PSJ70744.1 hypothetical protein C7J99_04305 [Brevibacillus brevis]RED31088.1 hypothetical protein DES34_104384 [Brevibacillus brevis]GEC89863.1 hypothetical protein BBR01nite_21940 [Brevibacillus brevis]VEF89698.1 Uncharacterised protein [Brevibacillus brevis]